MTMEAFIFGAIFEMCITNGFLFLIQSIVTAIMKEIGLGRKRNAGLTSSLVV